MIELVCATGNKGKLREFEEASGDEFSIRGCSALDCPETGNSFAANARQKALCYSEHLDAEWLFADDSGLVVDALNGEPGIYSARYAGEYGDDQANNRLLLENLRGVARDKRAARFVCAIALIRSGEFAVSFEGQVQGYILEEPEGNAGFGYDPLFYFPPVARSFGLASADEKWRYSHRGNAFRQMLTWLRENT